MVTTQEPTLEATSMVTTQAPTLGTTSTRQSNSPTSRPSVLSVDVPDEDDEEDSDDTLDSDLVDPDMEDIATLASVPVTTVVSAQSQARTTTVAASQMNVIFCKLKKAQKS